jgi:hypothetical protein
MIEFVNPSRPVLEHVVDQVTIDDKIFLSIGLRSEWGVYNRSPVIRIKPNDLDPRSPEAFKIDRQNRQSWTQGDTRGVQDQKFYLDFMDEHHFYSGFDFDNPELITTEVIRIPGPRELYFYPAYPISENLAQTSEEVLSRTVFESKRQLFVNLATHKGFCTIMSMCRWV